MTGGCQRVRRCDLFFPLHLLLLFNPFFDPRMSLFVKASHGTTHLHAIVLSFRNALCDSQCWPLAHFSFYASSSLFLQLRVFSFAFLCPNFKWSLVSQSRDLQVFLKGGSRQVNNKTKFLRIPTSRVEAISPLFREINFFTLPFFHYLKKKKEEGKEKQFPEACNYLLYVPYVNAYYMFCRPSPPPTASEAKARSLTDHVYANCPFSIQSYCKNTYNNSRYTYCRVQEVVKSSVFLSCQNASPLRSVRLADISESALSSDSKLQYSTFLSFFLSLPSFVSV